jgi:BirA family transcriptional regulator, biotin operon repressor / biotin---[acetyl-CoA-carboxylase] ligase
VSFAVGTVTAEWARQSKLQLHFFEELESTNTYAKDKASPSSVGLIVVNHQTAGRGRKTNTWKDEPGQTLLSSWIFPLPQAPKPVVTCRIGLSVCKSLSSTWPWLPLSLKAPNDIYLGDKKLAGLLIENIQQGSKNSLIIGLGLNVFSHPQLSHSISLANELKNQQMISEKIWHDFLDRLLLEFSLAATCAAQELNFHEQENLIYFLNRKPDLKEKINAIDADGSLHTASGVVDWHQL